MEPTPAEILRRLDEACDVVRSRWSRTPALGIVAGSGLSAVGTLVEGATIVPYSEIPHMPRPHVVGHKGELVLGTISGLAVAVLSGRCHAYEGHPVHDVVHGVRLLGRLGAPRVMLTNAAGGIDPDLGPGSLCRLADHLNLTGLNPLSGPNIEALGPRFPDMTEVYDRDLGHVLDDCAADTGITLARGVYAGLLGPSYETPAEIRMLATMGASVVGMSTVLEAIALRHMGVKTLAVSVVSNAAAGLGEELLDHSDVAVVADSAGPRLLELVRRLTEHLAVEARS